MPVRIRYIDEVPIKNKHVLVRCDFDVSLNADHTIANTERIERNLPTLLYLLKRNNVIICVAKLGRPHGRDPNLSLNRVVKMLRTYLNGYRVTLINDFTKESKSIKNQKPKQVLVLENIRYYKEETDNDPAFAKRLAQLADIYVNDAFSMCHRKEASIVGVPKYLSSYGGLLLKKEVQAITKAIKNPRRPFIAIIGGAKIATKIDVLDKLIALSDYLLIGGGLANTFFLSKGYAIGKSIVEKEEILHARRLMAKARRKGTKLVLPIDVLIGNPKNYQKMGEVILPGNMRRTDKLSILDIGPETKVRFSYIIHQAKTIIWNGPMGYVENPQYRRGTDFLFYAIAGNKKAVSVVGGGDTITALSNKRHLDDITHISTGGGAMLELIEKNTLPGLEALKEGQAF